MQALPDLALATRTLDPTDPSVNVMMMDGETSKEKIAATSSTAQHPDPSHREASVENVAIMWGTIRVALETPFTQM